MKPLPWPHGLAGAGAALLLAALALALLEEALERGAAEFGRQVGDLLRFGMASDGHADHGRANAGGEVGEVGAGRAGQGDGGAVAHAGQRRRGLGLGLEDEGGQGGGAEREGQGTGGQGTDAAVRGGHAVLLGSATRSGGMAP